MNDPNNAFAILMQRPNIDEATQQYERLGSEVRQTLSGAIPELATWTMSGETLRSACGNEYPGITFNGAELHLPDYVVPGNLPDDQYERALSIIGAIAQKYGFTPAPQRLHDAPGSHDAVFHNVHDDGEIRFGTAKNTLIGVAIGCHLTAEAKKRGHPSPTPTY